MPARRTRTLAAVLGTAILVIGVAPAAVFAGTDGRRATTAGPSQAVQSAAIATDLAVQYARFYPRKDDYRDTNTISGTTLVPATVTIRIYNSGGTRIKSFLLGAQEGAYSVAWNGRKKDGSLFPQGTYTVKQFLTAEGTTETATHTVVLSHKKVTWYLGSQTRDADAGTFFTAGDGHVWEHSAHGIGLSGGQIEGSYAVGRYTFTLPSAHVFASLRISVWGKCPTDGDGHEATGPAFMGIRNVETGDLDGIRDVGYEWAWWSSSVPGEDHVNGDRKVQTYVRADEAHDGAVSYTKVKLTYKYGILGY